MASVFVPLAPETRVAATRSVKASVRRSVSFIMMDMVLVCFEGLLILSNSEDQA
jgi:uncharacterized membrane protein